MKTFLFLGFAAALALLSPDARANGPYHYGPSYGVGSGYSCGPACWATPGCCERPLSKNDHLWDNYCQEKWCPTVSCDRSRPYWHGVPVSSGCGVGAQGCASPSCGTAVGTHGGPVSYSTHSSGPVAPSPRPVPAPSPPEPPMAVGSQPPVPPAPQADEPAQLRLLPLSRPRASQPQL